MNCHPTQTDDYLNSFFNFSPCNFALPHNITVQYLYILILINVTDDYIEVHKICFKDISCLKIG